MYTRPEVEVINVAINENTTAEFVSLPNDDTDDL